MSTQTIPPAIHAFIRSLDNPLLDMDYHPGHERLLNLLSNLHLRTPKLRIRIAGTNGKGSTGYFLESMLLANGYSVGFYTSPHIFRFNERIRINGEPASDEMLYPLLERLIPLGKAAGTSPFELATALALDAFSKAEVDVEILECGLGAKLDAATAVPADAALITPIGLDHQAWLGKTIELIADDKAHALHGCRWGFTSPEQTDEAMQTLKQHHDQLITGEHCNAAVPEQLPDFQKLNATLACTALEQLQSDGALELDAGKMVAALETTQPPGRLQKFAVGSNNIWLDAAHNRHAVEAILPSLPNLAEFFDCIFVFTRIDRSLADELELLRPLAKAIVGNNDGCDVRYDDVATALSEQLADKENGNFLLLGSFTSVRAAMQWISK